MKAKTFFGMLMLFAVVTLLVTNARLHSQDGLRAVAPAQNFTATESYAAPADRVPTLDPDVLQAAPSPYADSNPYPTQAYPANVPSPYGSPADYGASSASAGQSDYSAYVETVSNPLVERYVELSVLLANRMTDDELQTSIAEMTVDLDSRNADEKIKSVRDSLQEIIESHPNSPAAGAARNALQGLEQSVDAPFDSSNEEPDGEADSSFFSAD